MDEAGVSHLLMSLQDAITGFSIYKQEKKKEKIVAENRIMV